MQFEVLTIPPFNRQLKRLIKKYPDFKKDMYNLEDSLSTNPQQGVAIGQCCYKIRRALRSKEKGKSGGARIITYLYRSQQKVYLLAVYDKSEVATMLDSQIEERLKHIPDEMNP